MPIGVQNNVLTAILDKRRSVAAEVDARVGALRTVPVHLAMAAEQAANDVLLRLYDVDREVRASPAVSIGQVASKLRIALEYARQDADCAGLDENWLMVESAWADLADMSGVNELVEMVSRSHDGAALVLVHSS